jgi:heat-inducible transcriptional repressor
VQRGASESQSESVVLGERQAAVLRSVVTSFVGEAAPIGSRTISHLLPVRLSSASIRNVLSELSELGLVEKPHASAGRVPTEKGLRLYVDTLMPTVDLAASERRDIAYSLGDAHADALVHGASQLLSQHSRQLGFVVTPRIDCLVLRHVSLVRLASRRLLVVLVAQNGEAHRRLVELDRDLEQSELDRIAGLLAERVAGHTLPEVRERLSRDASQLRDRADRLLERALAIGRQALAVEGDAAVDVVIETRLALLDQPEFHDPRRVRDLFETLEVKERLLQVLDRMLDEEGVSVAFGDELEEPGLRRCALVATRYGTGETPLGTLGVIGPSRMDFSRVVALVSYLSRVVTERLAE